MPGKTSVTREINLFISLKVSLDMVFIRIAFIKNSDSCSQDMSPFCLALLFWINYPATVNTVFKALSPQS